MPEIPDIRIPEIREFRSPPAVPSAPAVTLELGPPIIEMPGCVPVHSDSKQNPNLLNADPRGTGVYCPEGEIPAFNPMDFTPSEFTEIRVPIPAPKNESEDEGSETPELPSIPRLPGADAPAVQIKEKPEPTKPFLEKAIDGLPPVEAVVTTTTIALVAATAALVAKPFSDLILKLIKPTVKKAVKKISTMRGKPIKVDSVWQRRLAQRDRNRALRALRRALKP